MSGGGSTQTKVENRDPWAPAQPYLQQIMGHAAGLFGAGVGTQQYGGPLVAPLSDQTGMGINAITNTANSQMATAGQPYNYGQGVIQNNGLTSGYNAPMGIYGGIGSGANGITTGQDFSDIATGASLPTAATRYLTPMASGADAGKNPYLTQMLDANAARISNRVNSAMAGSGRFGSFGHGDALARSIGEVNNPILANAYETDRNRMLSASGQIDASNRAADATRLAATQGQTGVQGQNIANQLAGAAGQVGIQNFGQQNAANWASMMPQLQAAAYVPGNQLMAAGDYQNRYAQANIDAERQRFEQGQMMPWQHLARYLGTITGTSPLTGNAGTSTGSATTEQQTPWTQYAGLGLTALGLLSDRTEKTDIRKLGTDEDTGLGIYAYRYKGDPKTYPKMVGPMAQEVEDKFPGSTERVGGKLYVKPDAMGILGLAKKAA